MSLVAIFVLIFIALEIAALGERMSRQHQELIQWLDAYAEMVGEAIDKFSDD